MLEFETQQKKNSSNVENIFLTIFAVIEFNLPTCVRGKGKYNVLLGHHN